MSSNKKKLLIRLI